MVFVPGIKVTCAIQLEKVFTGWAPFQAPLFTETSTLDTATLSLAVPSTMKLALLTVKPAGTLVMLKVGGVVSRRMIETDNGWGAVATRASVTCTVKLKVPLVVGVPESRPLGASARPLGKVPERLVQL